MNNLKNLAGLLNQAAPEGEFLAYINPNEAKMLKDAGGAGLLTPQGIPSYRSEAAQSNRTGGSSRTGSSSSSSSDDSNDSNDDGGGNDNRQNYSATTQYSTTPQAMGTVDAENEYLAPDKDHFQATQKAIGKTNDELRKLGLDKSDYSDYTNSEKEAYQKEMNRLNGTEGVNYSFYKGNKGTTNLSFEENFKDVEATNPTLANIPSMRFLIAAGRTLVENSTTDYGTYKYGGSGTDGSGRPVDKGGWIGRVFNSDGTVNENLTEQETNDLYNQAQAELPFIIGNTDPQESMVNKYFANNSTNNLGISQNFMTSYDQAKADLAKTLNMTTNTDQFGYSANMSASNIYYNYLKEQGLL
tara:strand:+ start:1923 stop:2990 length:1068 start_codon:yes stop_codon:yes gene_type:complete